MKNFNRVSQQIWTRNQRIWHFSSEQEGKQRITESSRISGERVALLDLPTSIRSTYLHKIYHLPPYTVHAIERMEIKAPDAATKYKWKSHFIEGLIRPATKLKELSYSNHKEIYTQTCPSDNCMLNTNGIVTTWERVKWGQVHETSAKISPELSCKH